LAEDHERELLVWIRKQASGNNPATRCDIQQYVTSHYGFSAMRGWVNSFYGHHTDEICKAKSSPQEFTGLEIPRCFLDQTVVCIAHFVHGRPTELVFNLDEVGISEWEDRKTKTVVIPKSMSEQTIHHKINRNVKNVSVIACVSAAGESLIPYIVTSQDSSRVREQLRTHGVRFGTDLILKQRAKTYVNGKIFLEYLCMVFFRTSTNCEVWRNSPMRMQFH
jgi:hypothetical protein